MPLPGLREGKPVGRNSAVGITYSLKEVGFLSSRPRSRSARIGSFSSYSPRGIAVKIIYRGRGQYRGYSIEVFDYQYITGSGRSRQTHYFTPLLVHTRSQLGKIIIRPEGFLDKLAAVIGFDDIDLDYREFNKKFYVKSPDKKYAYDLLHSRAMEFLLRHSGITVETGGRSFLFYFDGKMSLREAPVFLDMGIDFAELLPGFLKTKIL